MTTYNSTEVKRLIAEARMALGSGRPPLDDSTTRRRNLAALADQLEAARARIVELEAALHSVMGIDHEPCAECGRPIATREDSLNLELNPDEGDGTDALCWRHWYIGDRCPGMPVASEKP